MRRFEYITCVESDRFAPNLTELNRLGAEGWRVVSVQPQAGPGALYLLIREMGVTDVR
jgi:hypothetical protein